MLSLVTVDDIISFTTLRTLHSETMGIMVFSLFWVRQDLYHQP